MPTIIKSFSGNPDGELSFLPAFKMRKLGSRIAIVGPNGVGKSKFLEFLANEIWSNRPKSQIDIDGERSETQTVAFIPDDLILWSDAHNTYDSLFAEHFNRILPTVFAVLREAAQQYSISFIPESAMSEDEKKLAYSRWHSICDNVLEIVGKKLSISKTGELELSGVHVNQDTLSKGESRLLQLAVALSAIADGRPMILIWDEPELHLHPKVVRKVLDVITSRFNCQIWIATHSLSLVSSIGIESVWVLSRDGLARGFKKKEILIQELFGGEEQVDQLDAFLSPIDDLACVAFARDSLGSPDVVGYEEADPQGKQVFDYLKERATALGRPLRLLDWGAGKGRLADAARYEFRDTEDISTVLEYTAFDISDSNRIDCIEAIDRVWGDGNSRWTNELSEVKRRFSHKKADFVSLVNVLHEIPPIDWVKVINDIQEAISQEGSLLIVEDLALPRGEMPNKFGFLLLDEASMRDLFGDDKHELIFEYRYNGRLLMAKVPGYCVGASIDGLKRCLERCAARSIAEIEDIRASGSESFLSGVKHMRSAMQFVNATLASKRVQ